MCLDTTFESRRAGLSSFRLRLGFGVEVPHPLRGRTPNRSGPNPHRNPNFQPTLILTVTVTLPVILPFNSRCPAGSLPIRVRGRVRARARARVRVSLQLWVPFRLTAYTCILTLRSAS